jgi:gamma-glutamyltranspeptidase/glutathione hydrolase
MASSLVSLIRGRRMGFAALVLACQPPVGAPARSVGDVGDVAVSSTAPASPGHLADTVPASWRFPLEGDAVRAARFLVVSDSPQATHAGVEVLEAGGNAIDAVVAVAFVLAVVYPEAGNLGGGGFAVLRDAAGERAALDFRETAPERASRDMYRAGAAGSKAGPRAKTDPSASKEGHLAAGVPGSVAGLWALHDRFGSKPWPTLLAPAIRLAREGYRVDERLARAIGETRAKLERFAATRTLLLPNGRVPSEGDLLRNPDLEQTLGRIAERGPAGFYSGETAALLVAEMARGGGIMSLEDLERYRPKWRAPIEFEYRGNSVVSMPPPSSGGVALALIANTLHGDELGQHVYHSPEHLHLLAEAMRRAFADRNALLGDPDFVNVPLGPLLSAAYGVERRRGVGPRATPSSEVAAGLPKPEGEHTTHLAVVDAEGAAISLTTTINDFFGSGVTVTRAGFLLNDEMDDFATDPGRPNLYGLIQGEANAVAPNKRMLSSMAPTLVLDAAGEVRAVAGARGGPRIISATWQVVSNIIDFGMDAQRAVNAPRVHQQWQPDQVALEQGGFLPAQIAGLEARGHHLDYVPDLASSPLILRDKTTGEWTGAPDPRRGGTAEGR